jgi:FKBP-type peptidyl-prolyl cis-trans isomerase FklB
MRKPILIAVVMLLGSAMIPPARGQQSPATQTQPTPAANPAKAGPPSAASAAPAEPGAIGNMLVPGLDSEKAIVSYAIGMTMGANFKKQSVEIDDAAFAKGVHDALSGGSTLLTDEQAHTILNAYQAELRAKQQEKVRLAGETNKQAGEAFLKANGAKDGVVTLPSGLEYKILAAGTGPKPDASDTVVCNYRGMLIDGTEFDNSAKHGGPATLPVSGVIRGWTEALQLMPVGSKWQLFIPADLAYGERGARDTIAPNSTLIFEVELVSINPKAAAAHPGGAAATPPAGDTGKAPPTGAPAKSQ